MEAVIDRVCHFCKKDVTDEFYCYGCNHYVCEECLGDDYPDGKHKVEDHQSENLEDYWG